MYYEETKVVCTVCSAGGYKGYRLGSRHMSLALNPSMSSSRKSQPSICSEGSFRVRAPVVSTACIFWHHQNVTHHCTCRQFNSRITSFRTNLNTSDWCISDGFHVREEICQDVDTLRKWILLDFNTHCHTFVPTFVPRPAVQSLDIVVKTFTHPHTHSSLRARYPLLIS